MSNEKRPIPWKIVEKFDLTPQQVSKQAQDEIDKLFEQPLLEVNYEQEVVKSNQILYDFLVLF